MSKPEYLLNDENTLVQFNMINEMLDDDPTYLKEFCEAGIKSFTKFRDEFEVSMQSRDLETLRKAGHRIKPVAQMIGIPQINERYQTAKTLLKNSDNDDVITTAVLNTCELCDRITEEFKRQIEQL